jgi:hypothetical protein
MKRVKQREREMPRRGRDWSMKQSMRCMKLMPRRARNNETFGPSWKMADEAAPKAINKLQGP